MQFATGDAWQLLVAIAEHVWQPRAMGHTSCRVINVSVQGSRHILLLLSIAGYQVCTLTVYLG